MSDAALTTVQNAARLLKAFLSRDELLGPSELGRRLGLGKSTVHRLLVTLTAEGLLEQDPRTGGYRLGIVMFELGEAVRVHMDLHAAAAPVLAMLRGQTRETAQVGVLDRGEVVYVDRLESSYTLRLFTETGRRVPAHCSSSGKVLLAFLPAQARADLLDGRPLPALTPDTITDPALLYAELCRVRARGWAEAVNEREIGAATWSRPSASARRSSGWARPSGAGSPARSWRRATRCPAGSAGPRPPRQEGPLMPIADPGMPQDLSELAARLAKAAADRTPIAPLSDELPGLDAAAGYAIQALAREQAGPLAGWKLGVTSRAKQAQAGIHEPVRGFLTRSNTLDLGEPLVTGELIQPRAEPEIVFILGRDLSGPAVTVADVLAATAGVATGIEILDSRYRDYRFTMPDVIADNTSAGRYVVGAPVPPDGIDLRLAGVVFEQNGEVADTAAGAAVLGHPAAAVAWLARSLAAAGEGLRAGQVVLSGGLTAAVPVRPRDVVVASIDRLGVVELAVA